MTSMMTARRGDMAVPTAFSPMSLSGMAAWFKADALTGLVDGDPVATWADQSGNARDLSQATSSKRPTYKTSIIGGKPVVRGDGVDDFLQSASFTNLGANVTIFVVGKMVALSGANTNICDGRTGGRATIVNVNGGFGVFGDGCGFFSSGKTISTTAHVLSVAFGTTTAPFMDGSAGTTASNGGGLAGVTVLGDNNGGTVSNFDMAEYIAYGRQLSSTERRQVEAYLGTKYAITVV